MLTGDCKAYNGRLKECLWTIAKLTMGDGKDYFSQKKTLLFPAGLLP